MDDPLVIIGLGITSFGILLSAGFSAVAMIHSMGANKAVNGRPKGEPVLWNMVRDIQWKVERLAERTEEQGQWMAGYHGSSLPDAAAVERLVSKVDAVGEIVEAMPKAVGCPLKTGEMKSKEDCPQNK
jgi:hypothetical protein